MVENRKYLQHEIQYVLSRILANWKLDTIAKAFKRDHAPYWNERLFTKKQVSYIRNTYKGPPGSVQPYNGPIPEFSPSPSPHPRHENSLRPLGMDPRAENTASTGSWPIDDPMVGPSTMMGHATQAQQVEVDQQTQYADDMHVPAAQDNYLDDAAMNEFFDFEAYAADTATPADAAAHAGPNQSSMIIPGGHFAQTGPTGVTSGEVGNSELTGGDAAHDQAQDLLFGVGHHFSVPDLPLPSTEEHHETSRSTSSGLGYSYGSSTGRDSGPGQRDNHEDFVYSLSNISDVTSVQQPDHGGGQYPRGYSSQNAGAHFSDGCEYLGAHDTCIIPMHHRHHWDGVVSFRNYQACVDATAMMYPALTDANDFFQGLEAYRLPIPGFEEQDQTTLASTVGQPSQLLNPQQNPIDALSATNRQAPSTQTSGFTNSGQLSTNQQPNNLYGPSVDGGLGLMNSLLNTPVVPFAGQNNAFHANNPRDSMAPETNTRTATMTAPHQIDGQTVARTSFGPGCNPALPNWHPDAIQKVYGVSDPGYIYPYVSYLDKYQKHISAQQSMNQQNDRHQSAHDQNARPRPETGRGNIAHGNNGRQNAPENAGRFSARNNGIQKRAAEPKHRSRDNDDYDPFNPAV